MASSPQHLDRLRLRHLRLLELVEEHRSLRAVGGVLKLTQPAVSQMVKDLEYALGTTLFVRSARGVTLTPAGEVALQRARSGLAAFDHLAEELNADLPPVVRVGTNPAVMFHLFPRAIARLEAESARLRFSVRAGMVNAMLDGLWAGDLDCYVGRVDWDQLPPAMVDVLRHDPLSVTELVIVCAQSHPLAGRTDLAAADLIGWSWALPSAGSNNRTALETAFRNLGMPGPVPVVEVESGPNALMLLARQAGHVICIPRLALDSDVARGTLCVLDLPDLALPRIQIGFVTAAHNETLAPLQTFRRALAAVAAGGLGQGADSVAQGDQKTLSP